MSFRVLRTAVLCALAAVVVTSCKDDDDDEYPSLSGTLSFKVGDEYILLSDRTIKVTDIKGITHPEGKEVGYFWKVTPGMSSNDTLKTESSSEMKEAKYTLKDSLGTYTITVTPFASGYSATAQSKTVTLVTPGFTSKSSITGAEEYFNDRDGFITDSRDGRVYSYTTLGDADWFMQNLAYEGDGNVGAPYMSCKAMNDVFGRFYSWDEANSVCPDGWRLPSETDWVNMAKAVGGNDNFTENSMFEGLSGKLMADVKFNTYTTMWEYWPAVKKDNESKFTALPAGFAVYAGNSGSRTYTFENLYEYAAFWTSSDSDSNSEQGIYRYIIADQPDMMAAYGYKDSFAANVRCVRDR